MKKIALFVLLTAAGGILLAQTSAPAPAAKRARKSGFLRSIDRKNPQFEQALRGTLGLSSGRIAVKSGGITYYIRGLERFIGFIDGLKDGAQVSLEGYVSAPSIEGQTERLFFPVKLTLNGKDYEVGSAQAASGGTFGGRDRPLGGALGGGRMGRTGQPRPQGVEAELRPGVALVMPHALTYALRL